MVARWAAWRRSRGRVAAARRPRGCGRWRRRQGASERCEAISLGACPRAAAVRGRRRGALHDEGLARLGLVLGHLREGSEMGALAALQGGTLDLGGAASPSPPPPPARPAPAPDRRVGWPAAPVAARWDDQRRSTLLGGQAAPRRRRRHRRRRASPTAARQRGRRRRHQRRTSCRSARASVLVQYGWIACTVKRTLRGAAGELLRARLSTARGRTARWPRQRRPPLAPVPSPARRAPRLSPAGQNALRRLCACSVELRPDTRTAC